MLSVSSFANDETLNSRFCGANQVNSRVLGQIALSTKIQHIEIDKNHLIEIGSDSFVLFGPEVEYHTWKT